MRVRQHNGSAPFMGRHRRRLPLEAGYARAEATASASSAGAPEEARRHAAFLRAQLEGFGRGVVAEGWMDQHQLTVDAVAAEIDAWAERPGALLAGFYCAAVRWVAD